MLPMPEPAQRRWRDPIPHRIWVLLGLCVALSAIGFVQFRWIDEVAKAQRERAVAALQASVTRFATEFDAEITRAHFAFQFPVPGQSSDAATALRDRLAKLRGFGPPAPLVG